MKDYQQAYFLSVRYYQLVITYGGSGNNVLSGFVFVV